MRTERDEVIEFARRYEGKEWNITSIDIFCYKDTGERLYSANLVRMNWDGTGDREIRIMVAKENGSFRARQAELSKWPHAWIHKPQRPHKCTSEAG